MEVSLRNHCIEIPGLETFQKSTFQLLQTVAGYKSANKEKSKFKKLVFTNNIIFTNIVILYINKLTCYHII